MHACPYFPPVVEPLYIAVLYKAIATWWIYRKVRLDLETGGLYTEVLYCNRVAKYVYSPSNGHIGQVVFIQRYFIVAELT